MLLEPWRACVCTSRLCALCSYNWRTMLARVALLKWHCIGRRRKKCPSIHSSLAGAAASQPSWDANSLSQSAGSRASPETTMYSTPEQIAWPNWCTFLLFHLARKNLCQQNLIFFWDRLGLRIQNDFLWWKFGYWKWKQIYLEFNK